MHKEKKEYIYEKKITAEVARERIQEAFDNMKANISQKSKKETNGIIYDVPSKFGCFYTNDYEKFEKLKGNRVAEDPKRIKVIVDSINRTGVLNIPIVVNENLEVVDGQARLVVFKELGIPVLYTIQPGLTSLKDCISLNVCTTPWKSEDYIHAGVSLGDENYEWYAGFIDEHTGRLPGATKKITEACLRPLAFGTFNVSANVFTKELNSGNLKVSEETKDRATTAINFLKDNINLFMYVDNSSRFREFCFAMYFLSMYCKDIDMDVLKNGMAYKANSGKSLLKTGAYLEYMDDAYKRGAKATGVDRVQIYKRFEEVKKIKGKSTL